MPKSRICSIEGCGKLYKGYGYCQLHYRRFKKHGDPLAGGLLYCIGDGERYLLGVVLPFEGDECLEWPFNRHPRGYGSVYYEGRQQRVNRVICRLVHGEPHKRNWVAAHRCGNAWCCNPKHLNWKTVSGNQMDRVDHGTSNRGKAHWNVRLAKEQVLEIRRLEGSKTQQAIADQFGVSLAAINGILRRRTWGWLD